ncbi:MAG: hypothetical protein QW682_08000, partial [Nitrososphaerota archaeon]
GEKSMDELKEVAYVNTRKQQITVYKTKKCFIVSNGKKFYMSLTKEEALNTVIKALSGEA